MDLFPYAKKLEMKLKHFNFFNAEEILENFSFFNYYNKFSCNKNQLQSLMLEERPGRIKKELYCHDIEKYNAEYYRFCLKCFEEDSEKGVPYWHITHNLPGVIYCEKHKCKLVSSDVKFNGKKLIALSSQVKMSELPLLNDSEEKILKLIAEQTFYLIHQKDTFRDTNTTYLSYLYENGYLKNFALDKKKLINSFMNFFSPNICKIISIDKEFVISTIIRKINDASNEIHPLFHILFIIFCGKKIKDLNESNPLSIPFDSDLFIEQTCKCFDGFFIHNSTLRVRKKGLIGSFRCICGNSYYIESWNNRLEINYGESFYEKVLELLFIEDLSISEVSSRLNISKKDLKNHLISKRNGVNY